ncbi:MAG: rRNA maturation RNase YbeY [Planctomycetaceae bacterium]|nr:rRNA maturation RNase YbeY [Planctomycetaceae bacterium]
MSDFISEDKFLDTPLFPVEIINEQDDIDIDESKVKAICSKIVTDSGVQTGRLGVVFVDNATIHELNKRFLGHDYETDVISFSLERTEDRLEGELVISTEMACQRCEEFNWDNESELMLYVIHGTLHLTDYNDQTDDDVRVMRQMEMEYLSMIGIEMPNLKSGKVS